jgi:hypothetical protein
MSDRGKIRSRRVTGNCAQHQRALAMAIKTARELVLLPYTQRTVTERPGGRGGRDRGERTLDSVPTEAPRHRPAPDAPAEAVADAEAVAVVEQAVADAEAGAVVEVVVEPAETGADA